MKKNPWPLIGYELWTLGVEAWTVVALRTAILATGGKIAETEARRMVAEKVAAGLSLQSLALTGGLGATAPTAVKKATALYRGKVRANRKRLSKR